MDINTKIVAIRQLTPSVKGYVLDVGTDEFDFAPGQWIDFYIDQDGDKEPLIGGFTMVSSPTVKGTIELAIKREKGGAAAVHIHNHAKVGDSYRIVGADGDFFFKPEMADSLVLVAGGIGINPLVSMIRYVDAANLPTKVSLVYSSSTRDEFVFYDDLQEIAQRNSAIEVAYTVTGKGDTGWSGHTGRIDEAMLKSVGTDPNALYFLCGPPGMPTQIAEVLKGMGVPDDRIRFEEW